MDDICKFMGSNQIVQSSLPTTVEYKTNGEVAVPGVIRLIGRAEEESYVVTFANHKIEDTWTPPSRIKST